MRTLSPSLRSHQAAPRRRPALRLTLSRWREAIPLLAFGPAEALPGSEAPHALALSAAGSRIQVVNDGGTLRARRDAGPWSASLASLPADAPVALTAVPGELVVAFADGTALRTLSSFDDGVSWSAPATRVTEAVALGSVALAGRADGNLCAFYTLGATPILRRLRRTGGTWATSGTTWTLAGAWATISGITAIHAVGDFHLLVTGTAPATGDAVVAAHQMGDGALPVNVWFGPAPVARADALSGVTFERPSIAHAGLAVAAFREVHAGPVAAARAMLTQAVTGTLAPWAEPLPFAAGAPFGLALAADSTRLVAASVTAAREAPLAGELDCGGRLRALRWRLGPARSDATLELDDRDGALGSDPLARPGAGVALSLGYAPATGGAPEYGAVLRGTVARALRRRERGAQVLRLEVAGPWERLAAARAPAAWRTPPGTTRGEAIAWLAARAGIPMAAAGDLPPSGAWTTETVDVAIQAGESAAAAALRLLDPTPDALRAESAFAICGLTPGDPPAATLGGAGHPLFSFQPAAAALPAWTRIQGPGRLAEAFDGASLLAGPPAVVVRRETGAGSDALATAFAERLLARLRGQAHLGRAVIPFHAGLQLFDVVVVVHPLAPGGEAAYRVLGIETVYRAGGSYEAHLVLGELG